MDSRLQAQERTLRDITNNGNNANGGNGGGGAYKNVRTRPSIVGLMAHALMIPVPATTRKQVTKMELPFPIRWVVVPVFAILRNDLHLDRMVLPMGKMCLI